MSVIDSQLGKIKQRRFWKYRRFWFFSVIIVILFAKFFLPNIPLLKGTERKISERLAAIDSEDIPADAVRITSYHEVSAISETEGLDTSILDLKGPLLVAGWKCKIVKYEGACLRYIWKGVNVTLAAISKPKNLKATHHPIIVKGKSGYLLTHETWVIGVVSNLDLGEILEAWPLAQKYEFTPTSQQ